MSKGNPLEFYKETRLKEVALNGRRVRIPEEWKIVRLGEVGKIIMGQSPPGETYNEEKIGILFLQGSAEFGRVFPKAFKYTSKPIKIGEKGSVLISVRAPVGEINLADTNYCIGRGVAAVKASEKFDNFYLFYYLKNSQAELQRKGGGSTFKSINKNDLESFQFPLPSLPEQKKIAHVLKTIDDAIEAVQRSIEKLGRIKKGLMERLLTRGINHTRFKKVELNGRKVEIPEEWEVVELGDVISIRMRKSVHSVSEVAVIPMDKIPQNSELFAKFEIMTVENVKSLTYCEAGDLLLAKITPSFENGKQGIVPFKVPNGFALATTEVYPIVSNENLNVFFLFYLLKYKRFRKILEIRMTGTTGRQRVQKTDLLKLQIPLPPLPEQKKIAEILMTIDNAIELKEKKKEKLEKMKKAVMELLLTGKVRVR